MTKIIRFHLLIGCLYLGLGTSVFAQTNTLPQTMNPATQNALLQIQAQLHDAQSAIDDVRAKDAADAATNAAILTARIEALEQTVIDQRASEIEAARKAQQITLVLAGVIAAVGFGALLLVFYFQWRVFSQFAEISTRQLALQSANPSLVGAAGQLAASISAPARATIETSNLRLLTLVEQLEKRVVEMEHAAHSQIPAASSITVTQTDQGTHDPRPAAVEQNGHHQPVELSGPRDRIANLLADGQTLLNAEQPENALKLFEEALALDGHNTDVLIKKAGALERLNRVDDAIACYNRAIELDTTATMAWLQKGGLFNRLARYDEAMQCYEKALNAQGSS
jgi:tetratricopeptide (TPR) repeat protein